MLDTFADQAVAITVQPTVIFFGNTWDTDHAPYFRVAAQIGHERAQQLCHVDVVGLGPSRSPIHLNARRIDDVVADTVRLKEAMQPEPVITGLVARDDLHWAVQLSRNT